MATSTWRASIAATIIAPMMLFTACSGNPSSVTTTEKTSAVDQTSTEEGAAQNTTTNDATTTQEPTGTRKSPILLESNEYAYGDGKILIDGLTYYEYVNKDEDKGTTYTLSVIIHVKYDGMSESDLHTVNDKIALGLDTDPPDSNDSISAYSLKEVDVESGQDLLFSVFGSPESYLGKALRVCIKDKTNGEKYFYYPVKVDSFISSDEMNAEVQRFGFTGL